MVERRRSQRSNRSSVRYKRADERLEPVFFCKMRNLPIVLFLAYRYISFSFKGPQITIISHDYSVGCISANPNVHNQNMTLDRGIKFPVTDEMIAYAPCTWEIRVSHMENRIPAKITEIICRERGAACAPDSSTFKVIERNSVVNM